jgi:hypothetical protein
MRSRRFLLQFAHAISNSTFGFVDALTPYRRGIISRHEGLKTYFVIFERPRSRNINQLQWDDGRSAGGSHERQP